MSDSGRFSPRDRNDILSLVEDNPLAWVFVTDEDGPFATAAPMRPLVIDGDLRKLVGHVPRRNRIARCLARRCSALVLFLGPHGYISPSWMRDRTQAPTWNFTSAQFVTDAYLVDDADFLQKHLRDLTEATEKGRDNAWRVDEMGSRLEKLSGRIVAFEAIVVAANHRFKLGQDENDKTFGEILHALEGEDQESLVAMMRAFNDERR